MEHQEKKEFSEHYAHHTGIMAVMVDGDEVATRNFDLDRNIIERDLREIMMDDRNHMDDETEKQFQAVIDYLVASGV